MTKAIRILALMGIAAALLIQTHLTWQDISQGFQALVNPSSVENAIRHYEAFIIGYLLLGNTCYLMVLALGCINSRRKYLAKKLAMEQRMVALKGLTPVSVLMPAYNEQATAVESISSMLKVDYPEFEVIVCNDGSTDGTMATLKEAFALYAVELHAPQALPSEPVQATYKSRLYPHLLVLDKVNGGKSDALNAAINYSKHPLICCVDCDSLLDAKGLSRVAAPFFEDPEHTLAVGGVIRLANDTRIEHGRVVQTAIPWRWLTMVQIVEYLRAFLIGRMGWDYIGCNTIISGAFGLFAKDTVVAVGGYDPHTIGEDFELLLRIHLYAKKHEKDYHVAFLPDPVCWTEAPEDLKTLGNQRSRWQQGLGESLWKSRRILFSRWGGRIGWIALPYLWLFELFSAPLELLGYLCLVLGLAFGVLEPDMVVLFFGVSIVYSFTLTLGSVVIEEVTFNRYTRNRDFIKLFIGAIIEQLGFRQFHLIWRTRGMIRWLRKHHAWGDMKRVGFSKPSPDEAFAEDGLSKSA